jgi:ParB-like chromosome segregation protein Spo0J
MERLSRGEEMPFDVGGTVGVGRTVISNLLRSAKGLASGSGVKLPTSLIDRIKFSDKTSRRVFDSSKEGRSFSGSRTSDEISDLRKSIQAKGIQDPITIGVDANGGISIVDGTHRFAIAKELGLSEIPIAVTPNVIDDPSRLEALIKALSP